MAVQQRKVSAYDYEHDRSYSRNRTAQSRRQVYDYRSDYSYQRPQTTSTRSTNARTTTQRMTGTQRAYQRGYAGDGINVPSFQRGTAVPVTRPNPRVAPAPKPKPKRVTKTKKQKIIETRRSRAMAIKVLTVAAILFSLIVVDIYSEVRLDELDSQIASVNSEIEVMESANTRLSMAIESGVSLAEVEDYAVNTLGMVKLENYQVNYLNLSDGDSVEVSGGKTKGDGLFG